jgi:choline dehydrogenase-like flavoprotein
LRQIFETRSRAGIKLSAKLRASDAFILEDDHVNCAASFLAAVSLRQLAGDTASLIKRMVQNPGLNSGTAALRRCVTMGRILLPAAWSYLVERRAYNLFSDEILIGVEVEQLPTAASYLCLAPHWPPDSAPIGVHWSVDGREIRSLRAFCRSLAGFVEANGLGRAEIDNRITDEDPSFFDDCEDAFHQMGGARMARDSTHGVVGPELRVFGVENLWAVGAAVFPSGSFANPTLLAMALAHRLADHLVHKASQTDARCCCSSA